VKGGKRPTKKLFTKRDRKGGGGRNRGGGNWRLTSRDGIPAEEKGGRQKGGGRGPRSPVQSSQGGRKRGQKKKIRDRLRLADTGARMGRGGGGGTMRIAGVKIIMRKGTKRKRGV